MPITHTHPKKKEDDVSRGSMKDASQCLQADCPQMNTFPRFGRMVVKVLICKIKITPSAHDIFMIQSTIMPPLMQPIVADNCCRVFCTRQTIGLDTCLQCRFRILLGSDESLYDDSARSCCPAMNRSARGTRMQKKISPSTAAYVLSRCNFISMLVQHQNPRIEFCCHRLWGEGGNQRFSC